MHATSRRQPTAAERAYADIGCPAGRDAVASARRGSSESCSASGGWRSPSGSPRGLCHHTRIPASPAPVTSPGEPATNSARDGWTPNLSRASLYGSGLGLYAPAASAVTTVSKWTPTRAAARCPSSSEQLVTTPIRTHSLSRLRTSGASGHGPSRSPSPRSRSGARVGGTPASRAASATVSTNGRYGPVEYATRLLSSRQLAPTAASPATSRHSGSESRSAVKRSKRTASYSGAGDCPEADDTPRLIVTSTR
jgi:hypothetical protein